MKTPNKYLYVSMLALSLTLSACGGDNDNNDMDTDGTEQGSGDTDGTDTDGTDTDGTDTDGTDTDGTDTDGTDTDGTDTDGTDTATVADAKAVVVTIDSGFTASAISIVDTQAPYATESDLNAGISDTVANAYNDNYYVIRRFGGDSVEAYALDGEAPIYNVSTNSDSEESSNPYGMVFVSEEKAYLLRYGSSMLWVVNPSVTDAADFKIGEIDLGRFDPDGIPDMSSAVIVGDKLYVIMQRLDAFTPTRAGYVAVIDTTTDTLQDGGIVLPGNNPSESSLDADSDTIFVAATGRIGFGDIPSEYTGGLFAVDTTSSTATQLIDDDENTGHILKVEIVDSSTGYLAAGNFGASTLQRFNPVTGAIEAAEVAGLVDVNITDIALGPNGNLWVGVGDLQAPKIVLINPADDSIVNEGIPMTGNPSSISFVQ